MFGKRKGSDGTAKTGSVTPASKPAIESGGPRMYRADSAMAPVPRAAVVFAGPLRRRSHGFAPDSWCGGDRPSYTRAAS